MQRKFDRSGERRYEPAVNKSNVAAHLLQARSFLAQNEMKMHKVNVYDTHEGIKSESADYHSRHPTAAGKLALMRVNEAYMTGNNMREDGWMIDLDTDVVMRPERYYQNGYRIGSGFVVEPDEFGEAQWEVIVDTEPELGINYNSLPRREIPRNILDEEGERIARLGYAERTSVSYYKRCRH